MKRRTIVKVLSLLIVSAMLLSVIVSFLPGSANAASASSASVSKADNAKIEINDLPAGAYNKSTGVLDLTGLTFESFYGIARYPSDFNLKVIKFPKTLKVIERNAFNVWQNCELDFSLSTELHTIRQEAFIRAAFKTLDFSKTKLTTIEQFAFNTCGATTYIFPATLTTIADKAFQDATGVSEISLGNTNLTSIGVRAFNNSKIKLVSLPKTLKTLGDRAFATIKELGVVDLNSTSITSLSSSEFRNSGITWLSTGASMKSIGYNAFAECTPLSTIAISRTTSVEEGAFTKDSQVKEIILVGSESTPINATLTANLLKLYPSAKVTNSATWPTPPSTGAPTQTTAPTASTTPPPATTTPPPTQAPSEDALVNGDFAIAPVVLPEGARTVPIRAVSSNRDNQPIMSVKPNGFVIISKKLGASWFRVSHVANENNIKTGYMNAMYVGAPVEGYLIGVGTFEKKAVRDTTSNAGKAVAWVKRGETVMVKGIEPVGNNGWLKVEYYPEGNQNSTPIVGYMNTTDLILRAP